MEMKTTKGTRRDNKALERLRTIHRKVGPAAEPELSDALGEPAPPREESRPTGAKKQARAS